MKSGVDFLSVFICLQKIVLFQQEADVKDTCLAILALV